MSVVHRVLDAEPVANLESYLDEGGGRALAVAVDTEPAELIRLITAAGLRGRGGGGFPTGVKWQTVADNRSTAEPTAVIVNAAEGEPGTFKDRAIIRRNPYRVLEGALIAARAVGAPEVVVAIKASFRPERRRLQAAIDEFSAAGLHDIDMRLVEGPSDYLFGEESAMLEVVEGRYPFPRVTPPYRRGIDDPAKRSGNSAAWVELADDGGLGESPALIDNVETMANVPGIVLNGPEWFREVGTQESPGTIVCTITGDTMRHAVGEFAMGTPLWDVVDTLGGGARPQRTLVAAISGTANRALEASQFDTPVSYEGMAAAGSGLGAAGFIVFDDETDLVAVAQGIARFLAVESCGQCVPCKSDGAAIAELLDSLRASSASADVVAELTKRFEMVDDGARCALAGQQRSAVASLVELGRESVAGHLNGTTGATGPFVIAPIADLVHGRAVVDTAQFDKHDDWSYGGNGSGKVPAELYENTPVSVAVNATRTHGSGATVAVSTADAPATATGPTSAADRFAAPVVASHERLLAGVGKLTAAVGDDRAAAAAALGHELGRYIDLVGTVVYPELSRVDAGRADDAAWLAERNAEEATRILDSLHSPDHADGSVRKLATDLRRLIDADDSVALPILCRQLDDQRLDELATAMQEIVATGAESAAGSRFGSSPD